MNTLLKYAGKHVALIIIGIMTVLIMEYFGLFLGMSHFCYDWFFRLRGPQETPNSITIVAVDEKTLHELGQWPLKRHHWASLLDQLRPARVVGFDILMLEATGDDHLVASAVEKHGRVIMPAYITKDARMIQSSSLFEPLSTGHIHLEQDIDGVVRKVFHTLYSAGHALPSFSSLLYEAATQRPFEHEPDPLPSANQPPIIQRDCRRIDYYGPQGSFPVLSLADVIAGKYEADFFRDRIILVGVTAEGLEAGVITPFSQPRNHMSGVEAHAHIVGGLIEAKHISVAPLFGLWSVSLFFFGVFFFLMLWLRRWHVVVVWLSAVVLAFWVSFGLFSWGSLWWNPIPLIVLLFVAFFLAYIVRMEVSSKQIVEASDLWEDSFKTIDEAIWVTDGQGAILKRNHAAVMLMADPPIHDIITDGILARLKDQVMASSPLKQSSQAGKSLQDEIIDTASERHFAVKIIPRRADCNPLPGFVVVVQDISEQRKSAREKQRLEAELMQAQKMEAIGTLAGGVAHDFNNILMGIQGYVSLLLLELSADDPQLIRLKKIEAQVQNAAGLTRQLLGFARGGKYEVRSLDPNMLIEKSSEVFIRTKKEIAVSIRYQEQVWPVMADAGQLEQVLLNLYINSWQAMPDGGDLYLETENVILGEDELASRDVQAGRYVRISVTDSGSGMDEATRRRAFEPFFTTKEPGKGTGLGLASAYGIISNHGGFIELESQLGKGSTFRVYLPAIEAQPRVLEQKPEKVLQGGKETVLVVDDEVMNVTVMKEILETLGYRVLCAGSGQEALSIYLIKKDLVDLIILDMIMPGMGGGAAFDAIRSLNPKAKIILSSGYNKDGEATRILARGCNGFIQKPFRISELSEIIQDVLKGRCDPALP